MLSKDIGLILAFTGVGKKSVVVDAGTGSGFLAASLANVAKKVVTYEWREEFANLAQENFERAGLKNIKLKRKDIFAGISEENVDLVCLDMAESDKVVASAFKALKKDGYLVGYLPHTEQVKAFVGECVKAGFSDIFTVECILREMLVREAGTRPDTKGLWHTAYLTFARK